MYSQKGSKDEGSAHTVRLATTVEIMCWHGRKNNRNEQSKAKSIENSVGRKMEIMNFSSNSTCCDNVRTLE
jgi:hypothetical protein